jgi:hypothetical protein
LPYTSPLAYRVTINHSPAYAGVATSKKAAVET